MKGRLLTVNDLRVSYGERETLHGVSFELDAGEILCIAGESGSGKSTLLRALIGIDPAVSCEGSIIWQGRELMGLPYAARRALCGSEFAFIAQDPGAAFHPVRSYGAQLREMLKSHGKYEPECFKLEICETFIRLGLPDWERILKSCPYEMSGGMNQRINIAAAMLLRPRLLLADEPTSALDVTIQKQVAEELKDLRRHWGISQIIVTHNLGLVAFMADKLGVMKDGELVEYGEASEILRSPQSDYTRLLLDSVPSLPKEGD